jgi:uncharacterized protein (TIGR02001 family)
MKLLKLSLAVAVLATGVFAAEESEIGISANVAATSNYVWRGMTQSDDAPAIQGGFDVEYKGFYLGTWGSSVQWEDSTGDTAAMEADFYAGYTNELYGVTYDIGAIKYVYPNIMSEFNFAEVYLGLGYDFEIFSIGAKYSNGIKVDKLDAPDNIEGTVSVPLPAEISLNGAYGAYGKDGDDNAFGKYYSVGLSKSLGKFEITLAYTGMDYYSDGKDSENNFVGMLGASF